MIFPVVAIESFIQSIQSAFMEHLLDAQDCSRSLYDNEQNPVPGFVELSFKGVGWEKTDGKACKQIRLWYNVRKSKVRQRVRAGFSTLALVTFWMR